MVGGERQMVRMVLIKFYLMISVEPVLVGMRRRGLKWNLLEIKSGWR